MRRNKDVLEPHVNIRFRLYMKYRYSHKTLEERREIKKSIVTSLLEGGKEKQLEFCSKVDDFLETNKETIAQAKRHERNDKQYQS